MPDYGHELRFGSFVTPVNAAPQHAAGLSVLSEDLGLDVVTFQDHPYQAGFLDTWTLLTWVAARTSRIHVAGNVLNLPLRPPAVLARAVASLDLLSGGRAVLGLGAGGLPDAVAAMGGPRRTIGQAVSALDEALDVIRGIWAGDDPGPLRVDGRFYRVDGLRRGPSPAHHVPIWLGAYKPRMQRIIGAKADGWLPSSPALEAGDLARGNRVIDAAATAAGRDPKDITRLLNVTPADTAADLARAAAEDGVSVFILAADDPDTLQRFATTMAAEIRERVAEARAGAGTARRTVVFGGEQVPATLAARALTPVDRGHHRHTAGYFRAARPGLVLRPRTIAEVQDAVRYAARHRDVPLGLLSGGHGLSGRSLNNGGIVLALDAFTDITPLDDRRVRLGPGARWGEVARRLAPHRLAITAGDHGGVGVGGLATTGGIGWFVRQHGLTIDHLRAVEVVTAGGELVRASAEENPGLFWAMRGAGANFGVAVSFEIDAHPVPDRVGFAMLTFVPDDVAAFLHRWGRAIERAHPSVTGTLMAGPAPRGLPAVMQALVVVGSDDQDEVVQRLTPLLGLAPLADRSVRLVPYHALLTGAPEGPAPHGRHEPVSHAGLVRHLTRGTGEAIAGLLASDGRFALSIRSAGGAVADTAADATAYAWRDANFLIAALGGGTPGYDDAWRRLATGFEGTYLSFETDTGPDALARAFPPAHLHRLRGLKREWDPAGLFRDNFAITPVP
ncbi:LLM class flavin-dependent oxidoreductase [Catenuloplanes indicus]|uniref:Alkanesulfonate monooxygenase SsuD/methylene tetrahydromethanopterin reductase-like flavin-dependent oxidoreductase (Luciferase family) n=1 Tax=Catenuloplanes indicus TaxID=137267 RepID=A0AAE4AW49_9ACTN|nr:LLM class flavin-dependent oxidoreductase [Catenuloplanes indicus]MDQ0364351.1 alkanesulfonate monooxygenase SsuD/methylene tetrahydromethanopterin reductase-like flavin-dependent oxidoreductase (luciferase family) [Catenuloplanes indicus]